MIRYDKKFNNEIRKIVNRYNSKVNRMSKSLRDDIYVPEKLDKETLKSLKASSKNRAELRRQLKLYENYSKRGGETYSKLGKVSIPKFEKNRIRINLTSAKRISKSKIQKYETKKILNLGKEESVTYAGNRNLRYINEKRRYEKLINDIKNIESFEDIEKLNTYVGNIINVEKTERLNFEHFIDGLDSLNASILGSNKIEGTDIEKTDYIKLKLLELTPEQYNELYDNDIGIQSVVNYFNLVSPKTLNKLQLTGDETQEMYDQVNEKIDELYSVIDKLVSEYKDL